MAPRRSYLETAVHFGWIPAERAADLGTDPTPEELARRGHLTPPQAEAVREAAQSPPPEEPFPPRLGRYYLLREIGRGGMGRVFKAFDGDLERPVVVKLLLGPGDSEERERFLREARCAAVLRHPHVVEVHDIGVVEGRLYFVMDYVEGSDLERAIDGGLLRRDEAVEVLRQAADAVAHAHANGILHRDLKPGNILVDDRRRARVADFGLALQIGGGQDRLTRSGTPIGTPAYMSPEQARGDRAQDERTDVWGLGATLYHVLTGSPPFGAHSLHATLAQIVEMDPARPRRIDPTIPEDLETVCLKALEKDPARRYGTVREFESDLRRYLHREPVRARPPSTARRVARALHRRRVPLLAVAGALSVAIVAGALFSAARRNAEFDRARASAQAAHQSGDWSRAVAEAERATAIRPDEEVESLLRDSRARLDRERAARELQERLAPIREMVRDVRLYFYIKGEDVRGKLDRLAAALSNLESWLQNPRYASLPDGWQELGIGRYYLGEADAAETAILRSFERGGTNCWAWYALGCLYIERGMLALMHAATGSCHEDAPLSRTWSVKAAEAFERSLARWDAPGELDREIAEVWKLLAEGKEDEVKRRCADAIARLGTSRGAEEFWMLRGWVDHDSHVPSITRAIEIRPHYPLALISRASVRAPRDYPGAIEDCTSALRLQPNLAVAYALRANYRKAIGELDAARADYDEALRLAPGEAWIYVNRSILHAARGEFALAAEDDTAAIRLAPDWDAPFACRADHRRDLRDWDGAVADYTEALARKPGNAGILIDRALIHWKRDDRATALADMDAALRLDPLSSRAWYNRGNMHLQSSNWDAALADFTEAIRILPNHFPARRNRAGLLLDRGKLPAAMADLDYLVEHEPNNPENWGRRGEARIEAGQRAGAIADLERALQLAPKEWRHRAATERLLNRAQAMPK